MTTDSPITKTHLTPLRKVHTALKVRQKMNTQSTQLLLSDANQIRFNRAAKKIAEAINILNNVK